MFSLVVPCYVHIYNTLHQDIPSSSSTTTWQNPMCFINFKRSKQESAAFNGGILIINTPPYSWNTAKVGVKH